MGAGAGVGLLGGRVALVGLGAVGGGAVPGTCELHLGVEWGWPSVPDTAKTAGVHWLQGKPLV
jgi:hypothetical protein